MRRRRILVGLGLFALLCGCVPSLHPLYTDKDLIFVPGLVGRWAEKNSKETWHFQKAADKNYKAVYTEANGKEGRFDAHLLKVDGHMFLDLFPEQPQLEQSDFYKFHLLGVHTFFHVKQIEPTLQMRTLDPEWFKKFLKDHPDAIRHEKREDLVVLTAQPKEMQAFLIKYLDTKGVFGEFSDMQRAGAEKQEPKSQKPNNA